MNCYLISFDLVQPGRNYQPIYDYMETFATRAKPLQTVYLVQSALTPAQIRDRLQTLVDGNDKVLVIQISTTNWASVNLPNTATWLNAR